MHVRRCFFWGGAFTEDITAFISAFQMFAYQTRLFISYIYIFVSELKGVLQMTLKKDVEVSLTAVSLSASGHDECTSIDLAHVCTQLSLSFEGCFVYFAHCTLLSSSVCGRLAL